MRQNQYDYLTGIGKSKKDVKRVEVDENKKNKIEFIELLSHRSLIPQDFKNDLISHYVNQKINDEIFKKNVDKCVSLAGSAEFKLLSLDDSKFKLKNHTLEYVGSIPLLPDSRRESSINDGKVSYEFAEAVCSQLQNQILTLREINVLSDIFRFDLLSVINAEQLTIPEG